MAKIVQDVLGDAARQGYAMNGQSLDESIKVAADLVQRIKRSK